MEEINMGYVYDKCGLFWEDAYTPNQLKQMEDAKHSDIEYIRHNLYSQKIKSDNYKIIFVNATNPYFRRWNIGDAERNGFSSVCETKLHKACKLGIAKAKTIRIKILGKDYILNKKWSDTEVVYQLMGNKYETDCEIGISDINEELRSLLNGDVLYLEVHHKSKVKPQKMMAFKIAGFNMLEFDIQTKYLPYNVTNEKIDENEMIQFFTDYYEDIKKHYISGTFYSPIVSDIVWTGGIANVMDHRNGKKIEIKIYKDRYSKKRCYNIIFICDGKTYTQYNYDGKDIDVFYDAKLFAMYLVEMHLKGKINIDFK